ncbi:hemolysin family protein [Brooklawnia cerclae]|uniref:CBS domain containing-hemolysin-like protein n=1 Tax=Brooklawnia cerclae TaxID=349934 RepID=A0ABX0SCN1_9ACTN|nr:hemolysin family protein [Brooklawnia cerclae]NIH56149.1 CBS domain containing-hemolysin-like protein [Brooklawnia cerclae]
MTSREWIMLAVALVLAALAMVMTVIETAMHAITPTRAERMVDESLPGAAALKEIVDDPAPEFTAARLLKVLAEVSSVVLVTLVVVQLVGTTGARLTWSIAVMVVVSFVAWGVAPRTLGRLHAERVARSSARPMSILATLLWPASQLLIWFGNVITPGPGYADGPFSPEAEKIAEASEGEREMINSVFELGDTLVREVMVPRTDVVYLERAKTLRQGLSLALRSGFSRIPVIGDDLDDVVGIVYLKDLMKRVYDNPDADRRETVDRIMRSASFTPDSKPVDALLREMQLTRNHIVVVVDEFGGTAGIATIEDLVEEIVGEITDEYDAEPDLAEEAEPGLWRVSARMPVDDMGDLFGLDLDDEDVETVGGLLAKELNMVPIKGSHIEWRGLDITAEKATGRRHQIDTVLVRQLPPEPEDVESEDDDDE